MNLSNAVGAVAGVALAAILGVSVLKTPESATTVVVADTDAPAVTAAVTLATTPGADPGTTGAVSNTSTAPAADPSVQGGTAPDATAGAGGATPAVSAEQTAASASPAPDGAAGTLDSTATPTSTGSETSAETSVQATGAPPASTGVAVDKAAVRLGVVNASGKAGVATTTSTRLTKAGWSPKPEATSSPSMGFSVVYYATGERDAALAVASALGLTEAIVLAGDDAAPWKNVASKHFDVLVLAGKDLR